jgi:signal transduction histidine kinase
VRWHALPLKRLIATAVAGVLLTYGAWSVHPWHRANKAVPTRSYQLQAAQAHEWQAIGGDWKIADNIIRNYSGERGAKLLVGSHGWENYTLNADMRFDGVGADMGVVVRSNTEMEGVDTYNGYYVGLRTVDGTIVIGRSNFGWIEARPLPMPGGVRPAVWYRLRVTAYKCNIAASVQNLDTLQTAWMAFEERSCVETGRVGVRSLNAGGAWRNISIAPAGRSDYEALRQHADFVERPEIPPGPPWWTPWHVGALFFAVLALALLSQGIYFRVQEWKACTITLERERLAHQIHDTMAQSFAGIGYQIQGIRSNLVRSEHFDAHLVAGQLGTAYQLIRSCHEEASRTISMLSASSPHLQQNLVSALEETARKIAGDDIRTIAELRGNPPPLSLRLTDALLHIGQQAIANAVSHANPAVLTISFAYDGVFVELIIGDDGRGFNYTSSSAGFGILGMQKRARDVSGVFQILSTPENGTQVRVKVKVQQDRLRERILSAIMKIFQGNPAGSDVR